MPIYRAIYISRVARRVRFVDAEEIARDAAVTNERRGVTGMLIYTPSHFIQVLEGDETEVNDLLSRIRMDDRHHEFHVLEAHEVPAREFGTWAMTARQLPVSQILDPNRITAAAALEILRCARESA